MILVASLQDNSNVSRVITLLTFVFLCHHVSSFANSNCALAQEQESLPEKSVALTLDTVLNKYSKRATEKWEKDIQKLESKNKIESWPADSLLFFGSSSFRRWDRINEDMAPWPSINRGYGGARFVDMVFFAERMLTAHQYKALMLFAANDVQGKDIDSTPEEVSLVVHEIVRISKQHLPDAPIFIVEVTPTESRFSVWDKTRQINATLREISLSTPNVWFITTADHYLNSDGSVKAEYFVDDKLHLNQKGYQLWASLIKAKLQAFMPTDSEQTPAKR